MPTSSALPRPSARVRRFEQLGYGLFLHWGLYSQLGAGEWVMMQRGIPAKRYNKLAQTFTAAEFDAGAWARLARDAGMRYITLTTRHHEGFSLYDTHGLSTFDAPHTPAQRDLVAEFVKACRTEDIGAEGALGHPEIDSITFEQSLPKSPDRRGWPKYLAGEMCQTMNAHWGIGNRDLNYLSPAQIIQNLALSRKAGANYLLNVGPTAQGAIPDYEAAALRRAGQWVALHDEVIRRGRPVEGVRCAGRDFVLKAGRKHYYFAFDLPIRGNQHVIAFSGAAPARALLGITAPIRAARWLDNGEAIPMSQNTKDGLLALHCTPYPYGTQLVVRVAELS